MLRIERDAICFYVVRWASYYFFQAQGEPPADKTSQEVQNALDDADRGTLLIEIKEYAE